MLQENSISIACIWKPHQGTLWSFYLIDGKKNSKRPKQNLLSFCLACLHSDTITPYQEQQPFSVCRTKQSLPSHPKRAWICFLLLLSDRLRGRWIFHICFLHSPPVCCCRAGNALLYAPAADPSGTPPASEAGSPSHFIWWSFENMDCY